MERDWHWAKGRVIRGKPILLVAESCVPGHTIWLMCSFSGFSSCIQFFLSCGLKFAPGYSSPEVLSSASTFFCVLMSFLRFTCFVQVAPIEEKRR